MSSSRSSVTCYVDWANHRRPSRSHGNVILITVRALLFNDPLRTAMNQTEWHSIPARSQRGITTFR